MMNSKNITRILDSRKFRHIRHRNRKNIMFVALYMQQTDALESPLVTEFVPVESQLSNAVSQLSISDVEMKLSYFDKMSKMFD